MLYINLHFIYLLTNLLRPTYVPYHTEQV